MQEIIGGKRYDTETALCIADNNYWDGHNWERGGRNRYLYKTAKGNFFLHDVSQWQGELDRITAITAAEAEVYYEQLPEKNVEFKTAFDREPEIA